MALAISGMTVLGPGRVVVDEDVAVAAGEVAGEEEQVLQPVALLLVFKSSSRQLWELLWWRATRTWASKPV